MSFSLRSRVECKESEHGVSPFTSHLGATVIFVLFAFMLGGCFVLGFWHGFRPRPIGLPLVSHRLNPLESRARA